MKPRPFSGQQLPLALENPLAIAAPSTLFSAPDMPHILTGRRR